MSADNWPFPKEPPKKDNTPPPLYPRKRGYDPEEEEAMF